MSLVELEHVREYWLEMMLVKKKDNKKRISMHDCFLFDVKDDLQRVYNV
jgi:uncharacterized membrane protein